MIAMKFTIELDIGLSLLLQAALPHLVTTRAGSVRAAGKAGPVLVPPDLKSIR
jgi:hypothetical protein